MIEMFSVCSTFEEESEREGVEKEKGHGEGVKILINVVFVCHC